MIKLEEKFNLKNAKLEIEGDRITVGLAICGRAAGGYPVYEELKKAKLGINLDIVGCIGMCYNEPIVTVNQSGKTSIYGKVTIDKVGMLIDSIKKGEECKDLLICHDINELDFYKKQKRIVMANCGVTNPLKIEQYVYRGGYSGLTNALKLKPKELIEEIKKSGLRGRGGAGFLTGLKWSFIADKPGKKYIICNADEGDPGAFMNKTVVVSDPFKVIEGITIGAYAMSVDEGYVYARAESPLAVETIEKALKICYDNNLLGKNIMGIEGFNFDLHLQKGAGAFVCGEETALLNSIEGKRGMPRPRPPFPAEKGLWGKPTIINNVGSWAHVATIMKMGAAEYAKIGSEKTKGTKEICLTGKVKRTGVIEVPIGMPLKEIVFDIGGGCPDKTEFKAVLTGGPAGGCIPKDQMDVPLDYESLQALGSIMGSGGMVVLNNENCMVEVARFFMSFTQAESCGKCTPCREGTKRLLEMLTNITRGVGEEKDIENIRILAEFVRDNSLCGLGQNAPNPILSTLKFFRNEYMEHLKDKKCCSGECKSLMQYFITEKCVGCGNCARHCPVQCISGEPRKRYVIDQSKCIKCNTCYEVCAFKAIVKR
jgi:NADH:ubiquinone oxidoreductase subunit F (NADH-binding)/NAD-dependent dihydropyrimidine dehydrogenase PreA subunit/(2Fe-2S) ferredoxin